MSYDRLCDELMLMTHQIATVIVENKDGRRVCERTRKEIVNMDWNKASFGLLRGAQLVERVKEYRKELGNLHFIVSLFDNLLAFIFPLEEDYSLILAVETNMAEFKPFITHVQETIKKNNLQ